RESADHCWQVLARLAVANSKDERARELVDVPKLDDRLARGTMKCWVDAQRRDIDPIGIDLQEFDDVAFRGLRHRDEACGLLRRGNDRAAKMLRPASGHLIWPSQEGKVVNRDNAQDGEP